LRFLALLQGFCNTGRQIIKLKRNLFLHYSS
jgi:hypothetical protein